MVKELHPTKKGIEEKLARSLTAETTELLLFMPYLLKDFWELCSDPDVMIKLIEKHVNITENMRILDLACGKGAVSVRIAQKLRVSVKGILKSLLNLLRVTLEFLTKRKEYLDFI